jgi:cyclopropane fatty-acyl-phospholipid synthase-like methyltransferase
MLRSVRFMSYHAVHLTPDPARTVVWEAIAERLARWIPAQSHVLEIGAGYCAWINAVRAARRLATDIWPEVAQHAGPGVEARIVDASVGLRALGVQTFDVVLASNVLEHFAADTAAAIASDLFHLLRPGGRLLVIQPNFRYSWSNYFDDYTHRSIFTDVSLPAMLRAQGFAIDAVEPRFLPYSMRDTRLPIRRWLVRAYLRLPWKPMAGQMLVVARRD